MEISDVKRAKNTYTRKRACIVEGEPDAQTVWLKIGPQEFCVTSPPCETDEEAEWTRDMLAKALLVFLDEQRDATIPREAALKELLAHTETDRDGLEGLLKELSDTMGCKQYRYTEALKRAKELQGRVEAMETEAAKLGWSIYQSLKPLSYIVQHIDTLQGQVDKLEGGISESC